MPTRVWPGWQELNYSDGKRRHSESTEVPGRASPLTNRPDQSTRTGDASTSGGFYRTFFELMNEGGVTLDEMGRIVDCNPCFAMMVREPIDRIVDTGFLARIGVDSRDHASQVLESGAPDVFESRLLSSDGGELPILLSVTHLQESDRSITCLVVTDLSAQYAAAEAHRVSEEFNRAILNSIPSEVAVIDNDGKIVAVNEAWSRFAIENADPDGQSLRTTGIGANYLAVCRTVEDEPSGDAQKAGVGIRQVLDGGMDRFSMEYACDAPDRLRWFMMSATPLGPNGRGAVVVHTDITARIEAEQRIRDALAEKEVLLREVYHRTNNNMALIVAMLGMQSATFGDEKIKEAFTTAENKIRSMALVHEKLYRAKDLSRIRLDEYIRELVDLLWGSLDTETTAVDIVFDLDSVSLRLETAIPCGLILNELVTNSFKYAFNDRSAGGIWISLKKTDNSEIHLLVKDDGTGPPAGFDFRKDGNLGMQTIYLLGEAQLHGEVAFESQGGLGCRLTFRESDDDTPSGEVG